MKQYRVKINLSDNTSVSSGGIPIPNKTSDFINDLGLTNIVSADWEEEIQTITVTIEEVPTEFSGTQTLTFTIEEGLTWQDLINGNIKDDSGYWSLFADSGYVRITTSSFSITATYYVCKKIVIMNTPNYAKENTSNTVYEQTYYAHAIQSGGGAD